METRALHEAASRRASQDVAAAATRAAVESTAELQLSLQPPLRLTITAAAH